MLRGAAKTMPTVSLPLRLKGMTLIELMVAMVISLIASTAMVMLMANTLGTGTRTVAMTRLTEEMRTAMQIITRDLRRANFIRPEDARTCYANIDCLADLGFNGKIGAIKIRDPDSDGIGDCLSFWLDRNRDGDLADTDPTVDMSAFRLNVNSGIGSIEMLTAFNSMGADNCPEGTWMAITDPDIIDVQSFVVENNDTYTETISTVGSTQTVQKIRLRIGADLRNNGSANYTISREIGDQIRVRNNFTTP